MPKTHQPISKLSLQIQAGSYGVYFSKAVPEGKEGRTFPSPFPTLAHPSSIQAEATISFAIANLISNTPPNTQ